jgi:hypothetical protein
MFHEDSMAALHKEISNHSVVQLDHDYGRFRSINEKLRLAAETFVN